MTCIVILWHQYHHTVFAQAPGHFLRVAGALLSQECEGRESLAFFWKNCFFCSLYTAASPFLDTEAIIVVRNSPTGT
jgi:hypothetical protein